MSGKLPVSSRASDLLLTTVDSKQLTSYSAACSGHPMVFVAITSL